MSNTAPPITGTTEPVTPPQVVPITPPTPSVFSFTLTGNKGVDMVLAFAFAALSARGAEWGIEHLEVLHGYDVPTIATILFGALATVAASAWAWINSHASQNKLAAAVQAGINLERAGKSISVINPDNTISALPVTPQSAAEIIKEFASVRVKQPLTADALNQAELDATKR
jgi:hypothetical protein